MARADFCLTVDLDPIGHYLRARAWQPTQQTKLNAIYEDALPRLLKLLDQYSIRATFFVVGEDAIRKENRQAFQALSDAGHEVANHTMNHLQHFNQLDAQKIEAEPCLKRRNPGEHFLQVTPLDFGQ